MRFLARFLLLLALPMVALAVPNYINYQGRLLDNNGIPITQNNMAMVVSIWTASTAGTKLYQENQTVNVNDGVYAFQIGNGTGGTPVWNPSSLFNTSSPRFVELTVQGQTLAPRIQLLSAPFTLQSGNSDNLGGQPIGYFGTVTAENSLQNQISDLYNKLGSMQVMCEMNHGFWDGTSCKPAIAVLPSADGKDFYPISQLRKLWTESELELECTGPHYHAYPQPGGKGGMMPVKNCNGVSTQEEPDPRGCAFGKESAVVYIELSTCEAFIVKGDGK